MYAVVSYQGDGSAFIYELARRGEMVFVWVEKNIEFLRGVDNIVFENVKLENFISKHTKEFIIFDSELYGKFQTSIRKNYNIKSVGSSWFGEKIEGDRSLQYKLAQSLGIRIPKVYYFESLRDALKIVKRSKKRLILKQSGNLPKNFSWKSELEDNSDLVYHIEALLKKYGDRKGVFVLQEYVEGVEVATTAFWTRRGWLLGDEGDVLLCVNFEHKSLLEDNRGISVGEMGTVAFFVEGGNRIFNEFLVPIQPFLDKFYNYGCVDANCIVDSNGDIYLLEWTLRFGYPIFDLMLEFFDIVEFLDKLYEGGEIKVAKYPEMGIVYVLAFPVFPFEMSKNKVESFLYEKLIFTDDNVEKHFRPGFVNQDRGMWYLSDNFGYAGTITLRGRNLKSLMKKGVEMVESVVPVKKGFYRRDIGERVLEALELDYVVNSIFPYGGSKAKQSNAVMEELEESYKRAEAR